MMLNPPMALFEEEDRQFYNQATNNNAANKVVNNLTKNDKSNDKENIGKSPAPRQITLINKSNISN